MRFYKLLLVLPVASLYLSCNAVAGPLGTAAGLTGVALAVNWIGTAINNANPGSCGPTTVSFSGSQDPDDDEFLYVTEEQFLMAKNGYKNTNKSNSGTGHAYECDNRHCQMNQVVTMPKGHVFKGKTVNKQVKYQCSDPFFWEDKWIPVDDGYCYAGRKYGKMRVGTSHKHLKYQECSGFGYTDEKGTDFELVCREGPKLVCKAIGCPEGYKLDFNPGKCIIDTTPICNVGSNYGGKLKVGQTYGNPLSYLDCKKAGFEITDHRGVDYELVCNPGPKPVCKARSCTSGYDYDSVNGKCVEIGGDANKKAASGAEGKKTQKAKTTPGATPTTTKTSTTTCNCADVWEVYEKATARDELKNCVNNAVAESGVTVDMLKKACPSATGQCEPDYINIVADAMTKVQIAIAICENKISDDTNEVTGGEEESTETGVTTGDTGKVQAAIKEIDSITLKKNVWKDAEGNFNTARLVSDSVAGVVLGTAGGVITSVIVKKNQLKKGFEDVVCTVGGQEVGSYGDEITVGVR